MVADTLARGPAEQPHVLVVDDDTRLRELLRRYLADNGFLVATAKDAADAGAKLESLDFDAIVLDVMMPGEDGFDFTARLRRAGDIPILLLTAMDEVEHRITGLERGADDYLAKPFDMRELLARVRSVLRRTRTPAAHGGVKGGIRRFGDWKLDLLRRTLTGADDREVSLTTAEFVLLDAFLSHPLEVLTRDRLLDLMAGRQWEPYDRAVDVQVGRLRRKIESDPRDPVLIKTVRGAGYMFAAEVSDR
jgi:two-component system OmpR family response regulator